ncbi:TOMM precursor leader peptide-binding protein [Sphingomonas sp. RS6]
MYNVTAGADTAERPGSESGPRIKVYFSVVVHDADHVELRSGCFNAVSHFLTDDGKSGTLARIVAALDGRPIREVVRTTGASRTAIEDAVDHLYQLGAIETGPNSAIDAYFERIAPAMRTRDSAITARMPLAILAQDAIGDMIANAVRGLLPDAEIEILDDGHPIVEALNGLTLASFERALDAATIPERFQALSGRLIVAPQLPINPHLALVLNRLALALETPWLWGAMDGPTCFVGPLTVPRAASCFQCCETRVTMNLRETASYQRYKAALAAGAAQQAPFAIEAALQHILAGHLALEAVNFLTTGSAFTIGKTLSLYLPTMEFCFHDILRLPGCPACGPEPYVDEPELYFDMRAVLSEEAGGSR